MAEAEIYVMCTDCPHTVNIHREDGCHAYRCSCKKGRPTAKERSEHQ